MSQPPFDWSTGQAGAGDDQDFTGFGQADDHPQDPNPRSQQAFGQQVANPGPETFDPQPNNFSNATYGQNGFDEFELQPTPTLAQQAPSGNSVEDVQKFLQNFQHTSAPYAPINVQAIRPANEVHQPTRAFPIPTSVRSEPIGRPRYWQQQSHLVPSIGASESGYESFNATPTSQAPLSVGLPATHEDNELEHDPLKEHHERSYRRRQHRACAGPSRPRARNRRPISPCRICGKVPQNQSEANKHVFQHSKPFRCNEPGCDRTEGFATLNDLERHRKSIHHVRPSRGPKKGYICKACPQNPAAPDPPKFWPRKDNFTSHIRRKHPYLAVQTLIDLSECERPHDFTSESGYGTAPSSHKDMLERRDDPSPDHASLASPMEPGLPSTPSGMAFGGYAEQDSTDPSTAFGHVFHDSQLAGIGYVSEQVDSQHDLSDAAFAGASQTDMDYMNHELQSSFDYGYDGSLMDLDQAGPSVEAGPSTQRYASNMAASAPNPSMLVTEYESFDTSGWTTTQPFRNLPRLSLDTHNLSNRQPHDPTRLSPLRARHSRPRSASSPSPSPHTGDRLALPSTSNASTVQPPRSESPAPIHECSDCPKKFKRDCDLKKHKKRHTRPYGCTYPGCWKRFGSRNDWKRHQTTQHSLSELWRCGLQSSHSPTSNGGNKGKAPMYFQSAGSTQHQQPIQQCGKVFCSRQALTQHLRTRHADQVERYRQRQQQPQPHHQQQHSPSPSSDTSAAISSLANLAYLGRERSQLFWCGFCTALVRQSEPLSSHTQRDVTGEGRFRHIGDHYDKNGSRVDDWMCLEAGKRKGMIVREMKMKGKGRQAVWRTQESEEEDSDLGDDGIPLTEDEEEGEEHHDDDHVAGDTSFGASKMQDGSFPTTRESATSSFAASGLQTASTSFEQEDGASTFEAGASHPLNMKSEDDGHGRAKSVYEWFDVGDPFDMNDSFDWQ